MHVWSGAVWEVGYFVYSGVMLYRVWCFDVCEYHMGLCCSVFVHMMICVAVSQDSQEYL